MGKRDREVCMVAFKRMNLNITDEQLESSRSYWLAAITQNGFAFRAAPEEIKGDRALCMAAVSQHIMLLKDVSSEMKADEAIVTAAVRGYSHSSVDGTDLATWLASA